MQSETFAGRDVDENALGALDGSVVQQGTAHRAGGGRYRPIRPFPQAGPHQSQSSAAHDGLDIGEVQIDEPGHIDEVGDSLNRLAEDVVGIGEGVGQRRAGSQSIQQPLVGNRDDRVRVLLQFLQTPLRLLRSPSALENERGRHYGHGESSQLTSQVRD